MIVIGGENLIDLIQVGGGAGKNPVFEAIPGGSPYNTAIAAARQGQATGYLTPISSDTLGELLAAHIQADNVRLLSPRASQPSSLAVVSLTNGQPSYQFYRENTAERMVTGAGLSAALSSDTRIFSVGSLALSGLHDGPAWAECFHAAKARGVFCAIDPNIRPHFITDAKAFRARLQGMLGLAGMVKLSDEDIEWLVPGQDPAQSAAEMARTLNIPLLVLTLGAKGARAYFGGQVVEQAGILADPLIDTVGAGDTFMGTMLAQIQERNLDQGHALTHLTAEAVQSMLHRAAKAAAINCMRAGCNPPTLAEL